MASISVSDATEIAKEYYASGEFHIAAYSDNPGMGIAKKVKITGKHYDFPIQYGFASNRSRTASTALAKVNTTDYVEFNVTTVGSYNAKDIDQKAMAEVTDEGAFVDLLTNTIDSIGKDLGNGIGEDLYLHRGAALGVVGSVSTTSLVLADANTVTRFYYGQEVAMSSANGLSGALDAGTATVTGVDRDTGTLTSDANWTAQIAAAAAGRFIFNVGDFGVGRAGLADWVPDSTSGLSTAFYGAVRSVDPTKLAGCRQSVTAGSSIVAALRALVSRIGREEGKPDTALMSFDLLADLETELENKVYIDVKADKVDIGFEAISVTVGGRKLACVPDRSCDGAHIYVGKKSTLELIHSQEDVVKLDDTDGELLSRNASAFSYDIRGSSFSNYVVRQPMHWGVVVFS